MNFELNDGDVVSMNSYRLTNCSTAKVKEIQVGIKDHMKDNLRAWTSDDGISCEVLKTTGGGWLTGKIRVKTIVEFIPDELIPPIPEITDAVLGTQTEPNLL